MKQTSLLCESNSETDPFFLFWALTSRSDQTVTELCWGVNSSTWCCFPLTPGIQHQQQSHCPQEAHSHPPHYDVSIWQPKAIHLWHIKTAKVIKPALPDRNLFGFLTCVTTRRSRVLGWTTSAQPPVSLESPVVLKVRHGWPKRRTMTRWKSNALLHSVCSGYSARLNPSSGAFTTHRWRQKLLGIINTPQCPPPLTIHSVCATCSYSYVPVLLRWLSPFSDSRRKGVDSDTVCSVWQLCCFSNM